MKLLSDIQAAAVDPSHSLSDLLRRCQILAFRLRHEPFKAWVANELNGYSASDVLPPYRADLRGEIEADLSGPFGSSATDVPVPVTLMPKDARHDATHLDFTHGVAALESLVTDTRAAKQSTVRSPFPVEVFAQLAVLQGYATMQMWVEVPISSVVGVLDRVRSRALTFVLEIEAENPAAGETVVTGDPPVAVERVDQIFNTVVFGGAVAIGPDAAVEVSVVPGDLSSLMRYLERNGVDGTDREALAEAIEADAADPDREVPGRGVTAWLGRTTLMLAASGSRIGEGALAALIAAGVARYLGLV